MCKLLNNSSEINYLKSSELYNLLLSNTNAKLLKETIKEGIKGFRRGLSEKGRSLIIELKDEGASFVITKNEMTNLCNWYLKNEIDEIELEYVASALELSDDIKYDEKIEDELFLLATPEINENLSKEVVQKIINRLQSTA